MAYRNGSIKMRKLTPNELKKIKEKAVKESDLNESGYTAKVTVHLGTCGIAAGGEEVLRALNEEIEKSKRDNIKVVISACMGLCSSEPNVTVKRMGEDSILYHDIDEEKMRQIFQGHIISGEIQSDYALAKIR
jgi:NADP-reducing hydrogenase subunit HndB